MRILNFLTYAFCFVLVALILVSASDPVHAQVAFKKLLAPDGASHDRFGYAVSMSGDVVIAGAPRHSYEDSKVDGAVYVYRYDGASWKFETKLLNPNEKSLGDEFGWSVAISEDVAIVGAPHDDPKANESGSAFIFRSNGSEWNLEKKIFEGGHYFKFGWAVDISGDVAVVGNGSIPTPGQSAGVKKVYIYRYNNADWLLEETIVDPNDSFLKGTWFGGSVAVSGNVVIIGDPGDDGIVEDGGKVYIYRFNGASWLLEAEIANPNPQINDGFGGAVAISGETAVVSVPNDDDNGEDSGSAYVYYFNGKEWVEEVHLCASDGTAGDNFGESVDIIGDLGAVPSHRTAIVVGAYGDNHVPSWYFPFLWPSKPRVAGNAGSLYIYKNVPKWPRRGWRWKQIKLVPNDFSAGDWLGWSVGISNNKAIGGAMLDDENGEDFGSVYVFDLE